MPNTTPVRPALLGAVAVLALALPGAPALAQEAEGAHWGVNSSLGTGGAGGDFGNLLEDPVSGELSLFRAKGPWRYGLGINYGSFLMKEPYQDEQEWGSLQVFLTGTRMLRTEGTVRPYVQARLGSMRLHPRSMLFAEQPLPEDLEPGESPTEPTNGFLVGVVPGVEWRLGRAFALDTSLAWNYFKVDEYDLSAVGQPPRSTGNSWEARLGATWVPAGGLGEDEGVRDAWGVRRSYGWAAAETLGINFVASVTTEYIRGVNFAQISPRSWWHNIEEGFTYDDNEFKTNQYIHPFNGAAYYNSGRANGLGFWQSSAFAAGGAFFWECCGETHPMSFNDMISTGIGGIALGEAQYRLASEILDNRAKGRGRIWREIGAFVVDPVRGFNRLLSGHMKTTAPPNPEDPMDWRPEGAPTFLAIGARVIGEGESISENTETYGTVLLNHSYGNVFENTRRKPFDYMDFTAELAVGGEKALLHNVQIRGDLASWALGADKQSPKHVLSLTQHFDYQNNNAFEFGGQSVGVTLFSRFQLSDSLGLTTRVDGIGTILGAVNSDYAWLADVAEQERIREYDYGPGLGGMAAASLTRNGRPLLAALYRFQWLDVSNGSVYNKGSFGSTADHYLQMGGARLVIPVKGNLAVGTDAYVFFRESDYVLNDSATGVTRRKDIEQRNPQVRVYLAFNTVR